MGEVLPEKKKAKKSINGRKKKQPAGPTLIDLGEEEGE